MPVKSMRESAFRETGNRNGRRKGRGKRRKILLEGNILNELLSLQNFPVKSVSWSSFQFSF